MSRRRNFFLGVFSGGLTNVVATIIGIFSAPIGLHYFGIEKYGALAVISTILTYLSTSQIGIPTAVNVLASKAIDKLEQLRVIIKAFILSLGIVLIVLAGFFIYTRTSGWLNIIGKVPSSIYQEVARATFVSAILFLLNLPLSIFVSGFIASQKVYIERFYNMMASSVIPFIGLLLTVWLKGNLVFYAWVKGIMAVSVSLISIVHLLFFTKENRQYIRPFERLLQPSTDDEFSIHSIIISSLRFFIVGLAATVVWHTDNLIISHFFGVKDVTPYAITFKLITSTFFIFSVLTYPVLPMVAKAYSAGEFDWIRQTYDRLILILPLFGGFIWIASIAFAQDIINIWVGPDGYAGMLTVFALGGYGYACSVLSTPNVIATGLNFINVFIGWSEAIVNILLSIFFVKYLNMGIGGTALGTFLASFLTVSWMVPIYVRRRSQGKIVLNYFNVFKTFFLIIMPCLVLLIFLHYIGISNNIKRLFNLLIVITYVFFSYRIIPASLKVVLKDIVWRIFRRIGVKTEVQN
ncbi:MAG: MATE family efflux transporter [Candidatus Omnitrophica bacterium]|nr:MATE family efflux transporter [Candidatus Omnitrophota bacterium]